MLKELGKDNPKVNIYEGDCNKILIKNIFPLIKYENYDRALCILDPYNIGLDWKVIYDAGQSRAIEIFLSFFVMDMNMNILLHNPEKVDQKQINRMNIFWGDESWREAAYEKQQGLFDKIEEKTSNRVIVEAFRNRLKKIAGFGYVPEPIPMRNTIGATIYYLFFASPNKTGEKVVKDIFNAYKDRGLV